MTVLLNSCSQAVSSTEMARNFGAKLKEVTAGDSTHLVIFKDSKSTGVLVGIETYEAMQAELVSLRAKLCQ